MIISTLRHDGQGFVVDVPEAEVTRLGLVAGQSVAIELIPAPASGIPDDELTRIVARLVEAHRDALNELAR